MSSPTFPFSWISYLSHPNRKLQIIPHSDLCPSHIQSYEMYNFSIARIYWMKGSHHVHRHSPTFFIWWVGKGLLICIAIQSLTSAPDSILVQLIELTTSSGHSSTKICELLISDRICPADHTTRVKVFWDQMFANFPHHTPHYTWVCPSMKHTVLPHKTMLVSKDTIKNMSPLTSVNYYFLGWNVPQHFCPC